MGAFLSALVAGIADAIAMAGGFAEVVSSGAAIAGSISTAAALEGLTVAEYSLIYGVSAGGLAVLGNAGEAIATIGLIGSMAGAATASVFASSSSAGMASEVIPYYGPPVNPEDLNLLPGVPDWFWKLIPDPYSILTELLTTIFTMNIQPAGYLESALLTVSSRKVAELTSETTKQASKTAYEQLWALFNLTSPFTDTSFLDTLKTTMFGSTGTTVQFETHDSSGAPVGPEYLSVWLSDVAEQHVQPITALIPKPPRKRRLTEPLTSTAKKAKKAATTVLRRRRTT